jgi:hypothetical protein
LRLTLPFKPKRLHALPVLARILVSTTRRHFFAFGGIPSVIRHSDNLSLRLLKNVNQTPSKKLGGGDG